MCVVFEILAIMAGVLIGLLACVAVAVWYVEKY